MAASIILAFNMPPEKLGRLRILAARVKARLRAVEANEHGRTLGDIAAALPTDSAAAECAQEFEDEMLVMANLTGAQLNLFLGDFKRFGIAPVALKAVMTATNAGWTPVQLHRELCAEREAFAKGFSAHERR